MYLMSEASIYNKGILVCFSYGLQQRCIPRLIWQVGIRRDFWMTASLSNKGADWRTLQTHGAAAGFLCSSSAHALKLIFI